MPLTLLRPHCLILKNRILKETKGRFLSRDAVVALVSVLLMLGTYGATNRFLTRLQEHPQYDPVIAVRLASMVTITFFLLLIFSSIVSALSHLYSARDMPLLLTLPVSNLRIYLSRLIETIFTSSWMFLMFGLPAFAGMFTALELPSRLILYTPLLFIPFLVIPAAGATILVTVFVNLIPPYRIRDIMVLLASMLVFVVLFKGQSAEAHLSTEQERLNDFIHYLLQSEPVDPHWSPSRWFSETLACMIQPSRGSFLLPVLLLNITALGFLAAGYLVFDLFFLRGWGVATEGRKNLKLHGPGLSERIGPYLIPFHSQLRALCIKEIRMFVRDTTQSMQLLMLLMLTFVYLYNFRTLQIANDLSSESVYWWQVILAVANTAFGACVLAAIATRFVFPSVSLEGSAYTLLRCTPISIEQLLINKFITWFVPISVVSVILLGSGALAIQSSPLAIVASAIIAISMSIGITGLGVGVGAVYAKFDWESPAQVTASFGSLVYMLLAMGTILLTLIPATVTYALTCVPALSDRIGNRDYYVALICTIALTFIINWGVSQRALSAGAQKLRELET